MKELWEAAVALRGNIEPADYKRYVLPIIFLRFLSLRTRSATQNLQPACEKGSEGTRLALGFLRAFSVTLTNTALAELSSSLRTLDGTPRIELAKLSQ
jgi:type I restriction-modification system DNA methylase subunit